MHLFRNYFKLRRITSESDIFEWFHLKSQYCICPDNSNTLENKAVLFKNLDNNEHTRYSSFQTCYHKSINFSGTNNQSEKRFMAHVRLYIQVLGPGHAVVPL